LDEDLVMKTVVALREIVGDSGEIERIDDVTRIAKMFVSEKDNSVRSLLLACILNTKSRMMLNRILATPNIPVAIYNWLLEAVKDNSVPFIKKSLELLQYLPLNLDMLKQYKLGRVVKKLNGHEDEQINSMSKELIEKWTGLIEKSTTKKPEAMEKLKDEGLKRQSMDLEEAPMKKTKLESPMERAASEEIVGEKNKTLDMVEDKKKTLEIITDKIAPLATIKPGKLSTPNSATIRGSFDLFQSPSPLESPQPATTSKPYIVRKIKAASIASVKAKSGPVENKKIAMSITEEKEELPDKPKKQKKRVRFHEKPKLVQIRYFETEDDDTPHIHRHNFRDAEKQEASIAFKRFRMDRDLEWREPKSKLEGGK
jgi:hypothetical protein